MARFYQIARLTAGKTIFPDSEHLRLDLDGVVAADLIENDVAFQAATGPDAWFWLSGGGTMLLNGQYLAVVRRAPEARVNPGKFSLFTGRADNEAERADPALMVRELFEELLLYDGDALLLPRLAGAQPVIDAAYRAMYKAGVLKQRPVRDLVLTPVMLPTRPVEIRNGGVAHEHQLAWTAGADNDINVLSLFAADCDLSRLGASDGEFHPEEGLLHGERSIYLLDLRNGEARPLSANGPICIPQREAMTPALQFLLDTGCGAQGRE